MKTTIIEGNTYAVKDQLKRLGARWNPTAKRWEIDETKLPSREWARVNSEIHRLGLRIARV